MEQIGNILATRHGVWTQRKSHNIIVFAAKLRKHSTVACQEFQIRRVGR